MIPPMNDERLLRHQIGELLEWAGVGINYYVANNYSMASGRNLGGTRSSGIVQTRPRAEMASGETLLYVAYDRRCSRSGACPVRTLNLHLRT